MKKLSIFFFLFTFAFRLEAKIVERVIAVVNKEIILLSELNERIKPLMPRLAQLPAAQRKAQLKLLRKKILDQMIDNKLIQAQARTLKVKISDADLERAIADVMQKNNLTKEQLEEALRREGKSLIEYKEKLLRPQLLRMKVVNYQVRQKVSVSDDELKALYQKNLRKLGVDTKVRASHIFFAIPVDANDSQIKAIKDKAEKLLTEIKKGADFSEMAKKYSNDSVTRNDGGDLGYFGRGTLPPIVEDKVFALKKGELAGPLRGEKGYHLIKLIERKESSARSFKEVRKQLRMQVYGEKMQKATVVWLKELRKKSHVDIRL